MVEPTELTHEQLGWLMLCTDPIGWFPDSRRAEQWLRESGLASHDASENMFLLTPRGQAIVDIALRAREGPLVTTTRSCNGCRWVNAQSYRVQGDSGFDVSCGHPLRPDANHIGDSSWRTPNWCPVLGDNNA